MVSNIYDDNIVANNCVDNGNFKYTFICRCIVKSCLWTGPLVEDGAKREARDGWGGGGGGGGGKAGKEGGDRKGEPLPPDLPTPLPTLLTASCSSGLGQFLCGPSSRSLFTA